MGICSTKVSATVHQHHRERQKFVLVEDLNLRVALWQGFKSMQMKLSNRIILFKKTPTFIKSCHESFCKSALISNTILKATKYSGYLELISFSVPIMNSWLQTCIRTSEHCDPC